MQPTIYARLIAIALIILAWAWLFSLNKSGTNGLVLTTTKGDVRKVAK